MVFGDLVCGLCWVSDSENWFSETLHRVFSISSIRSGITIAKVHFSIKSARFVKKVHFFNERLVGFHLK